MKQARESPFVAQVLGALEMVNHGLGAPRDARPRGVGQVAPQQVDLETQTLLGLVGGSGRG